MLSYSRYKYEGWKRKREDYERKAGKKNERRIEFVYVVTPFHVQGRNDCNEDASIQTLILHLFYGKWHVQENQHRKQRYIFAKDLSSNGLTAKNFLFFLLILPFLLLILFFLQLKDWGCNSVRMLSSLKIHLPLYMILPVLWHFTSVTLPRRSP